MKIQIKTVKWERVSDISVCFVPQSSSYEKEKCKEQKPKETGACFL